MNRKGIGSMVHIPLGLIGFTILLFILIALTATQGGSDPDIVVEALNWSALNSSQTFKAGHENIIVHITFKFVDFFGEAAFEVAKASVVWGSANPDIVNPTLMVRLLMLALLIPIAFVLFKFLIILFILIKEIIQTRGEKRAKRQRRKSTNGETIPEEMEGGDISDHTIPTGQDYL